ncbi:GumC family protein [Primorskyibacter sp. S187A]|uniref:GumC family protein n=1 Tax=Primorskyibacter sp. S187A TaxID=3415130 RepID=UPI003C7B5C13
MDLRFYFSLFLRRIHYFVLTVVICSVLGILIARTLPTVYESEALLVVESEQIPGDLAETTVRVQAVEQLQIIQQRILARSILTEMANRLDIYADRRRAGERPLTADEIVQDLRERIKIRITGGANARNVSATLVNIAFTAPTGPLSASVTNEIVTLILREDVGMRTSVARETLEFFEQEVARLDRELSTASAAVLEFKEANIEALPDSLDFRRSQQAAAQERLVLLERQTAILLDQQERLKRLISLASESTDRIPQEAATPEQEQLQALKDQRRQLLAILSPENPRLKLIDQQIAPLEEIVSAQMNAQVLTDDGEVMTPGQLQLAEIEGQLEFLEDQKTQITAEIDRLTTSIEATPGNASTLSSLERAYAAIQQQYNEAVAARAKAETGDTIEALSKGQRITVIEQAVAPNQPTSPNRPLIAAAGVGGGVVLGAALVLLVEMFRPGIRRPADLTRGLGITTFATLPYLRTRREIVRRRLLVWGGLLAALALFAAALWAIDTYYTPLDLLLEQIQRRLR